MLEILVIDDNLCFVKNLVNNTKKIKISGIATTYKEAIENINNKNFDLILLDLNLIESNGIEVLQYLKNINDKQYINSVIIISSYPDMILKIRENPFVYTTINKIEIFDKLEETLNSYSILNNKEIYNELIKSKIIKQLEYLGYNLSYVGTSYLQDIIYIIIQQNLNTNFNLKKDIYPFLYEKYKKSYNNIKSNINKATEIMYYECDENRLKEYFNVSAIIEKPKPKYVIAHIVKKILENK